MMLLLIGVTSLLTVNMVLLLSRPYAPHRITVAFLVLLDLAIASTMFYQPSAKLCPLREAVIIAAWVLKGTWTALLSWEIWLHLSAPRKNQHFVEFKYSRVIKFVWFIVNAVTIVVFLALTPVAVFIESHGEFTCHLRTDSATLPLVLVMVILTLLHGFAALLLLFSPIFHILTEHIHAAPIFRRFIYSMLAISVSVGLELIFRGVLLILVLTMASSRLSAGEAGKFRYILRISSEGMLCLDAIVILIYFLAMPNRQEIEHIHHHHNHRHHHHHHNRLKSIETDKTHHDDVFKPEIQSPPGAIIKEHGFLRRVSKTLGLEQNDQSTEHTAADGDSEEFSPDEILFDMTEDNSEDDDEENTPELTPTQKLRLSKLGEFLGSDEEEHGFHEVSV